nr:MAG TPA: hypothetical protein [Caudoviricetes sp.]
MNYNNLHLLHTKFLNICLSLYYFSTFLFTSKYIITNLSNYVILK